MRGSMMDEPPEVSRTQAWISRGPLTTHCSSFFCCTIALCLHRVCPMKGNIPKPT
ncbi:uncharacterized protein B0H18DRAFT_989975 [Fomitopsis serialis]|uniref:uncharacterized protein n=1 Tax=Fomitopsis serialis TaxID=139415 RepID=UPI002008112B|nr:uncharacterized protein B0H18DRAFT_989975 [Neoantrodia serialis]KAH9931563.1 hypothetical protein B0H18DRAFT_989975 [Neoantrodia serialis]